MGLFSTLLLESEHNSVHELLFQLSIDVSHSQITDNFLYCLNHDFAISFVFVFQFAL
jgi:hypothetical protein